MKKRMIFLLFTSIVIACAKQEAANAVSEGQEIFKKYCVLCHGVNGKLKLNGAKDITLSKLTETERIALISKGKNTMTPFESILSPEQIKAVAAYTFTLK